jgi:hypothetical protein
LTDLSIANNAKKPKLRDLRLDFFRGIALLIIFVSHMPDNWLAQFKPGAFGFSDSADIFVFVSGYAAALAYAGIFRRASFPVATARVFKRILELYACNMGLFFIIAALCAAGNRFLQTDIDYIDLLNFSYFFENTQECLLGLFSVRYVPNYFDILTMYMAVLGIMPLLIVLARVHKTLAILAVLLLYLGVPIFKLELPAELAYERPWFFNPFAWQMLFYTGFAFGSGWIKPPPASRLLFVLCSAYVVLSIPLSYFPFYSNFQWLDNIRTQLQPFVDKTNLGFLRYFHFLCLAYMAVTLLNGRELLLNGKGAALFVKAGQQALPVFLTGIAMSFMGGMALDVWGRTIFKDLAVNAIGMALLILAAYIVAWFKSEPWKSPAKAPQ